jgi:hypothetical protein
VPASTFFGNLGGILALYSAGQGFAPAAPGLWRGIPSRYSTLVEWTGKARELWYLRRLPTLWLEGSYASLPLRSIIILIIIIKVLISEGRIVQYTYIIIVIASIM